jgi:4-methoxybenzoate monooxygenase (O-demethylating)
MNNAASLTVNPFDEAFLADPYAYHDAIRDAGPVVWLESIGVFAMARHAEVQAALKDHQTFVSARGVGLSDFAREKPLRDPSLLLEADPPLHDRTRGLMNKIVSPVVLKALRPVWQAKADALIETLVARREFDAITDLAEVYPMMIFPDTIGLPNSGREHLLPYATAVFNGFGPANDVFAQGMANAHDAIPWINHVCQRAQLSPGGWGMAIYEAADRGECSEAEAALLVRSFLSAGVDTTVNGIGHLLLALAQNPDQYARLRSDPTLIKRAFEESLRWDSTVQTFFRTAACDTVVAGVTIPEGSKLLLFLAAANRDPRHWAEPERFDIGRVTSGHVGFGFGIHQCLGQMVARLEAEMVLNALIPRVTAIHLTGEPKRRLNNTLHAIAHLPVAVEPA